MYLYSYVYIYLYLHIYLYLYLYLDQYLYIHRYLYVYLQDDVGVEHVVEEEQTEGDASGQDSGTEVWDGLTEGDGEYEDGDATGVHEDEEVPEQDRGSEGDVSEEQEEAVLVVGVENN